MNVSDHDALTRDDLLALMTERHRHCVSIYMRLAQVGQETPADGIRMKNLIRQAEEDLLARGLRRPEAEAILAPAGDIVGQPLRWQADGTGLALFLSEDRARRFRLPQRFEELAVVNDRYHIEQLVPLLEEEQRFYILALSRENVRVFEATPHHVVQIGIPDMPETIAEATSYDVYQDTVRWYSNAGNYPGARQQGAMFYGQGATKDFVKKETEGFFRTIDAALFQALKLEKAPLVLACLPEEASEYRNVNTYQHIAEAIVPVGPGLLNEDQLHAKAWEVVRPILGKAQEDALARFHEYAGTGRASAALEEIVPAAAFGRVDSLLLRSGDHRWGTFDAQTGSIEVHDERKPGDEDLLDVAAVHALAARGAVYSVAPELMPREADAAAVFRY